MFRWMNLLLCCFINYSGTDPVGIALKHVTGNRGGEAILPCDFKAREIFDIVLSRLSKNILDCQNEECESENGRVFKEGSCDIIIKDLRLRDAGKYFLRVHYTNDQTELERLIREYQLHIQDEVSVNTGEQLKLDVLLTDADKVETNSSGEWTEVWTRGHGVSSSRMTDSNVTLIINAFTSTDAGTYRVLDSEGEILITVTVTESGEVPAGEHKDDPIDIQWWVILLSVIGVVALVVPAALVICVIWKYKCQNTNTVTNIHGGYQDVPLQESRTGQCTTYLIPG